MFEFLFYAESQLSCVNDCMETNLAKNVYPLPITGPTYHGQKQ